MAIDLSKFITYSQYVQGSNGLSSVLSYYPSVPMNGTVTIPFAQFFETIFGVRYLCYPSEQEQLWTAEGIAMLQLYAEDVNERFYNIPDLRTRSLSDSEQETREIKAAPAGVLQSSAYGLGGEVVTRDRVPSFDEIRQYQELQPFISDIVRRFDPLFLPVVYGWDEQYPEVW